MIFLQRAFTSLVHAHAERTQVIPANAHGAAELGVVWFSHCYRRSFIMSIFGINLHKKLRHQQVGSTIVFYIASLLPVLFLFKTEPFIASMLFIIVSGVYLSLIFKIGLFKTK